MSHTDALSKTLEAAGTSMTTTHYALAELARTLAAQMDAAGSEPSTRLSAAYLSVLKDVSRVMAANPNIEKDPKKSQLARLRSLQSAPLRAVEG